ncbi:hypothetical protein [Nioella aestuarii]|uniref:hypothetical protein n=1 Tax=Nioella aestuarii TaxID=1662864 RepID=UPI003D7FA27E
MRRVLLSAILSAVLPVTAQAQSVQDLMNIQYWHACSHPDFLASFGYNVLVVSQATRDASGDGPGVTCNLLEVDFQGSVNLGCSRAAMLSQSWGLLDYSMTLPLQPLPCG